MSDNLGITFPAYERKFYNPDRAYLLVDSDYYKKKHLIKCFNFSSRDELQRFYEYFLHVGESVSDLSNEEIKKMNLPYRKMYNRIKSRDDIKGLSIGFRLNNEEILILYRLFPHITHLFMGYSYLKSLSLSTVEFLSNIWGINAEISVFTGVRVDLGICFQVEVYD